MAERLEENNIIVNYQSAPDDEAFTAASCLRMGVQEMTRFGMKEDDFSELADYHEPGDPAKSIGRQRSLHVPEEIHGDEILFAPGGGCSAGETIVGIPLVILKRQKKSC